MRDIAKQIANALDEGRNTVLVTVVLSKGSTPRNAGSQMLVSEKGLVSGTIGGGAMEGRAIAAAQDMVGQPLCRAEGVMLRQQSGKGLDMPCGGDASLLYTSVCADDAQWAKVAPMLLHCFDQRIPSFLALRCCEGDAPFEDGVALLDANGELLAGACDLPGEQLVGSDKKRFVGDWFVMPVPLPVRAIVFGGGHVGRATVAALSRVGFACTLFECRSEFAQVERVPDAQEIILGDYLDIASSLIFDERDFVIVMSHSHRFDNAILEQALRQPLAYLGFMGSRRKIAAAREYVLAAGISEEAIDAVHMPIGLEIEAETPEEIAVSVAAECIRHRALL